MTYTTRQQIQSSARGAALLLVAVAALAPVRTSYAELLPQACQDAVKEVADVKKGYLCVASKANACHQTSTRLAAVFLGDPAKLPSAKVELASFEAIYQDICGASYAVSPQGTCTPKSSSVYQMVYDDTKAGHSFLLACQKDKGCAVLQGVAGAFKLSDWITGSAAPERLMRWDPNLPTKKGGNLVPQAPDKFGKMVLLNGSLLYEWLAHVGGFVRPEGTAKSFWAFWACDARSICDTLIDDKGVKPLAAKEWDTEMSHTQGERIMAWKWPWGRQTCDKLDDVRALGVPYPSPYCSFPNKPAAVCQMGLGKEPTWSHDAQLYGPEAAKLAAPRPGFMPYTQEYAGHIADGNKPEDYKNLELLFECQQR